MNISRESALGARCPTCRAGAGIPCRGRTGPRRSVHIARMTPAELVTRPAIPNWRPEPAATDLERALSRRALLDIRSAHF